MTGYIYEKHIKGDVTFNEGNVDCERADISAAGSFIPAPTYTAGTIKCATSAKVSSSGSATLVIDHLVADSVELRCESSATLRIKKIDAKTVTIAAESSANLRMESGEIGNLNGTVKKASYACFAGKLTGRANIDAETASTWSLGRCL